MQTVKANSWIEPKKSGKIKTNKCCKDGLCCLQPKIYTLKWSKCNSIARSFSILLFRYFFFFISSSFFCVCDARTIHSCVYENTNTHTRTYTLRAHKHAKNTQVQTVWVYEWQWMTVYGGQTNRAHVSVFDTWCSRCQLRGGDRKERRWVVFNA